MKTTYQGPGFFTLLGVLFVGLKLANIIDWSWWWVLAPLWGPLLFVLLFFAIVLVIPTTRKHFFTGLVKGMRNKRV